MIHLTKSLHYHYLNDQRHGHNTKHTSHRLLKVIMKTQQINFEKVSIRKEHFQ